MGQYVSTDLDKKSDIKVETRVIQRSNRDLNISQDQGGTQKLSFLDLDDNSISLIADQVFKNSTNPGDLRSFRSVNKNIKRIVEENEDQIDYLNLYKMLAKKFEFIGLNNLGATIKKVNPSFYNDIIFVDKKDINVEIKYNFKTSELEIKKLKDIDAFDEEITSLKYVFRNETIENKITYIKIDPFFIKNNLVKMVLLGQQIFRDIVVIWDNCLLFINKYYIYHDIFNYPIKSCLILNNLSYLTIIDIKNNYFVPFNVHIKNNPENLIIKKGDNYIIFIVKTEVDSYDKYFYYIEDKKSYWITKFTYIKDGEINQMFDKLINGIEIEESFIQNIIIKNAIIINKCVSGIY